MHTSADAFLRQFQRGRHNRRATAQGSRVQDKPLAGVPRVRVIRRAVTAGRADEQFRGAVAIPVQRAQRVPQEVVGRNSLSGPVGCARPDGDDPPQADDPRGRPIPDDRPAEGPSRRRVSVPAIPRFSPAG